MDWEPGVWGHGNYFSVDHRPTSVAMLILHITKQQNPRPWYGCRW